MALQVSIDISMYPLSDDYLRPIQAFIDRLHTLDGVQVACNTLSTQVFGDYHTVMSAMTDELEAVFTDNPHTVFVMKLVGTNRCGFDPEPAE